MGNSIAGKKKEAPLGPPKGDMMVSQPKRLPINLETVKYTSQPRVPAITPTPSCNSYDIWMKCYYNHKMAQKGLDLLNSRIEDNTTKLMKEYDERRLQIKREIARAENGLLSERESIIPPLSINSCLNQTDRFRSFKDYDTKYFTPKPERPVLTPEMLMTIENASKPQPAGEALVEIDGVQLLRKDIRTLTGLNWLNDEIINAYMSLIVMRGRQADRKKVYAFNTFFYPKLRESGYNSIRRWTRKVDIFTFDYLLVPVHLGNHWCLAFVDLTDRIISYYDSLGGGPNGCCDTLLEYLRYESNDKKKQDLDDENWRLLDQYHTEGIPRQQNCSDCGVFACTYAEYLTRQAKLNFSQEHMPYFRKKMIYELVTKRILE